jgi:5,10-methenyltetrahydromethanopterin hydrogenase
MRTAYHPENARAMIARIRRAATHADIAKLERAMNRLWDIGAFRAGEAMRLHAAIMHRDCEIASR